MHLMWCQSTHDLSKHFLIDFFWINFTVFEVSCKTRVMVFFKSPYFQNKDIEFTEKAINVVLSKQNF